MNFIYENKRYGVTCSENMFGEQVYVVWLKMGDCLPYCAGEFKTLAEAKHRIRFGDM